jgi:hypothetical protein
MLKFKEIGMYKNAVNVGYCTADVVLHNGNVVTYDLATKKAALPSDGKETDLAIVINTIDKPEIHSPNEFKIEIGENPRLFVLSSLKGRIIEMDMDQVVGNYEDIKVGDILVANSDGKLEVSESADGYTEYFEVTEKTSYNSEGLSVVVRS